MAMIAALTTASVVGGLASSYSQSQAQKSAGAYQLQIAETNSRLANIQAQDAISRGEKEAKALKIQTKRLIGAQRAAGAAQGQDLEGVEGEGGFLDIQQESAGLGAMDALTIKNNAWREAWGYRVQGQDYLGRGRMSYLTSRAQARSTLITGGLTAVKDIAYAGYLSRNRNSTTEKDTVYSYGNYQ